MNSFRRNNDSLTLSEMIAIVLLAITTTAFLSSVTAVGGNEYCPGFIDQHGQWNNGFECPRWGDPGLHYCCGTDNYRFCCPTLQPPSSATKSSQNTEPAQPHHHVFLALFVIGTVILLTATAIIMCFYCRCCLVYQRRKRFHREADNSNSGVLLNRRHVWGFDFDLASSSQRSLDTEFTALRPPLYPEEDPPAYDDLGGPAQQSQKKRHPPGHDGADRNATFKAPPTSGSCLDMPYRDSDKTERDSPKISDLEDLTNQVTSPVALSSNCLEPRKGLQSLAEEEVHAGWQKRRSNSGWGQTEQRGYRNSREIKNNRPVSIPSSASTTNHRQTGSDVYQCNGRQATLQQAVSMATVDVTCEAGVRNTLQCFVQECR